ncbi:MAG: adventurous gliding motility protein CglE [Proteobacteria bacterium]|nr:adventurous gliding motility protein CglE [Pseudomonadota bacterium]MCP4916877.1 adventurous gliding motility protein CglE [Pseudomonadota bacterium]
MLLSTGFSPTASAQDLDSLDEGEEETSNSRTRRSTKKPDVKEITKGFYAKANVGGAGYLLDFNGFAKAGTAVGLAVGNDFLDREKTSAAWEIGVMQGIHNGCDYQSQAAQACAGNQKGKPSPYIQGDFRTYSFLASIEASKYPVRRLGIGVRAGGGGLISPLLMDETQYLDDVVAKEWGGINPGYHSSFKPLGFGGVTAEYYSKLSHFSIGADFDVFYAVGFDMGFNGTGYLKYTF